MVTTVCHFQPHRKCDFIGKFNTSGTKVEIRKLLKVLHQVVSGHMEISQHAVQT